MPEFDSPEINEIAVHAEVDKLRGFFNKNLEEPDPKLNPEEEKQTATELLTAFRSAATEAGAVEEDIDFGDGKIAKRAEIAVIDGNGFKWTAVTCTNVTNDNRYEEGLEYAQLYKSSSREPRVNAPAPKTSEYSEITIAKKAPPIEVTQHGYYAHPKGQQAFADSKENTTNSVKRVKAQLAEFQGLIRK